MKSMTRSNVQVCSRCTYDETIPRISFDDEGVCNYCDIHDELEAQYPDGIEGQRHLDSLADEIKEGSKGKKYDCVVGVSGGCDSSFLLVKMVELGLNPLAVHFDNTWNSPTATQNIYNVVNKLNVDLYTYVVDGKEFDDILRSFLLSGSRDLEAPTDLALASVLYRAAEKHGIKYVVEGHSFRTEGIAPLDWAYMDGRYIASIHKAYGERRMKTYPNMSLARFIWWIAVKQIKRVRPLYNITYDKEGAKEMLARDFGWVWYGGHHLENRYTTFWYQYFLPNRTTTDLRQLGTAALVRSGQLSRGDGLADLAEPVTCPDELLSLVKKRLKFSESEFDECMKKEIKTFRSFPNYKRSFELLRPLFSLLVKMGRVPKSFYMKFCFPSELGK
jgi:N-acetyl sugar amidotransferase